MKRTVQDWIDALESGDFKHGKFLLKEDLDDGPHHCCLGVLCEILNISQENANPFYSKDTGIFSFDGHIQALPIELDKVLNKFTRGFALRVARINDRSWTEDYTKQIKFIKENLPLDLVLEWDETAK